MPVSIAVAACADTLKICALSLCYERHSRLIRVRSAYKTPGNNLKAVSITSADFKQILSMIRPEDGALYWEAVKELRAAEKLR